MGSALLAGTLYFAAVFALGFVLGVLRTLVLAPLAGPTVAVAIELPILLAFAWLASGHLVARLRVRAATPERIAMGGIAFVLLMLAELGLSLVLGGRSPAEHLALYREPAHQLGLAGQLAFAAFPALGLLRTRRDRRRADPAARRRG
jgi:hypothetical protein